MFLFSPVGYIISVLFFVQVKAAAFEKYFFGKIVRMLLVVFAKDNNTFTHISSVHTQIHTGYSDDLILFHIYSFIIIYT